MFDQRKALQAYDDDDCCLTWGYQDCHQAQMPVFQQRIDLPQKNCNPLMIMTIA